MSIIHFRNDAVQGVHDTSLSTAAVEYYQQEIDKLKLVNYTVIQLHVNTLSNVLCMQSLCWQSVFNKLTMINLCELYVLYMYESFVTW